MAVQVTLVMGAVRAISSTKMADALTSAVRSGSHKVNDLEIVPATFRALRRRELIDGAGRITELGREVGYILSRRGAGSGA